MEKFYVYMLTNWSKTVLYTGYTNNLSRRLIEHQSVESKFTSKYNCFYCVYYEEFQSFEDVYEREHQIKRWSRKKKEWLISRFNPEKIFINDMIHNPYEHDIDTSKLNFEFVELLRHENE